MNISSEIWNTGKRWSGQVQTSLTRERGTLLGHAWGTDLTQTLMQLTSLHNQLAKANRPSNKRSWKDIRPKALGCSRQGR